MDEITFAQIVEAVCKHPRIYTIHGTYAEAEIYLHGFANGAQIGGHKHRNAHSQLSPFYNWLMARQDNPEGYAWGIPLSSCHPDDETALKELARLYRQYVEEVCR